MVISPDQYPTFHSQLENFETDIQNIKMCLNKDYNDDIIKFYASESIKSNFGLISKLALTLLSIPYSSCEVERVFSQHKLIKTPIRSALATETMESLLMMKTSKFSLNLNDNNTINNLSNRYSQFVNNRLTLKNESSQSKRKADLITPSSIEKNVSQVKFEEEDEEDILRFRFLKRSKQTIDEVDEEIKEIHDEIQEIQTLK